ncbi:TetR/AcrR family transcriptional regulator [Segnochrobactraceae bacterium EtOH-i3]
MAANSTPPKTGDGHPEKPTGVARRLFASQDNERRREIMEAAAALFVERGYAATSIRDIAERVGLHGGSLYYHIRSKDALFLEIHDIALEDAATRIRAEIAAHDDPWEKLEVICVQMLETQLDPGSITMPLMNDFRAVPPEMRARLVARRDAFEQMVIDVIDTLPLDPAIDRKMFRILLLNQINAVASWYRPGGHFSPADIGREILKIYRHDGGQPVPATDPAA